MVCVCGVCVWCVCARAGGVCSDGWFSRTHSVFLSSHHSETHESNSSDGTTPATGTNSHTHSLADRHVSLTRASVCFRVWASAADVCALVGPLPSEATETLVHGLLKRFGPLRTVRLLHYTHGVHTHTHSHSSCWVIETIKSLSVCVCRFMRRWCLSILRSSARSRTSEWTPDLTASSRFHTHTTLLTHNTQHNTHTHSHTHQNTSITHIHTSQHSHTHTRSHSRSSHTH